MRRVDFRPLKVAVSIDGSMYLRAGAGERVPAPYSFRWLLPAILRGRVLLWVIVGTVSLALIPFAFAAYAGQRTEHWLWAAAIFCCLPILRVMFILPVLTDATAFLLALVSATLAVTDHTVAAVVVALLAGGCRESAPVFAALWAWSPWPLLGVLGAGWWVKRPPPNDPSVPDFMREVLGNPIKTVFERRKEAWLDPFLYLFPWGGALVGLAAGTWQVIVTMAVAYAQLIVATDNVRLFQWAAPVLVVAAVDVLPVHWMPLLFVLTLVQNRNSV
jgi:hypothetical protein